MRILLVEDDQRISETIVANLRAENYVVDLARNSQEALNFILSLNYDLLILDVVLPGEDGISLCQQLRSRGVKIPILLVTAKRDDADLVTGLDAGADDYLNKPFDWQELLARIRALLRRGKVPFISELIWGDLCLTPSTREATYCGHIVPLTPTEYNILELFIRNSRKVFSAADLIGHLWSLEPIPTEATIRSHIRGIRKKLATAGAQGDVVETVYGLGYRLQETEELEVIEKQSEPIIPQTQSISPSRRQREQQTLAALQRSWEKFKDSIFEDVAFLEQALNLQEAQGTSILRQAKRVAHNLVGLLGSLRLTKSAEIALDLENLIYNRENLAPKEIQRGRELIAILRQVLAQPVFLDVTPEEETKTTPHSEQPVVLVIDDDPTLTNQLQQLGNEWGMQIEVALSLARARALLEGIRPDLIILDICFPQERENGLILLAQLRQVHPSIPVIVLTVRGELNTRLEVAQAQALAFLRKPYAPEAILSVAHQYFQSSELYPQQILVVDDDQAFLSLIQNQLHSQRLRINTLSQPQQFWHQLEAIVPDLLILDLQMPNFDGVNLCQVIRNDPQWCNLPVVFLTAYHNQNNLQRILAAGADDCLSKENIAWELETRINVHLQRARRLQELGITYKG